MNDKLYKMTDKQLSEIFAVEVAGWKKIPLILIPSRGRGHIQCEWENEHGNWAHDPIFATDANATLKWMVEYTRFEITHYGKLLNVKIHGMCGQSEASSSQPTFQRAICIALILAKRAEAKK